MTAILRHELRTLLRGWLVKLWLVAALFGSLVAASSGPQLPADQRIAMFIAPFLVFTWFLIVMVLGLTPVTGARSDSLADGILSRPIARHQFLLGSWGARVVLVLGVFLVTTVPFILWVSLAAQPPGDSPTVLEASQFDVMNAVTVYGTLAAVGVVALVLTFQVSLAFLFGTLLRNLLWAVVVLLLLWYLIIVLVLNEFRMEEFSPLSLSQAIPTLVRQPPPWSAEDVQDTKDAKDAKDAEGAEGAEGAGDAEDAAVVAEGLDALTNLFAPGSQKPAAVESPDSVQSEEAEAESSDSGQSEEYEDFSLAWVLFTYGVLTAGSIGLAILCFGLRDL